MSKDSYSQLHMLLMGLSIGLILGGFIMRADIRWLILVVAWSSLFVGFYCGHKADEEIMQQPKKRDNYGKD